MATMKVGNWLIRISSVIALVFPPIGLVTAQDATTTRQAEVVQRGSHIMPFDLEKTQHQFTANPDGGVQRVIAKDPADQQQIALIRRHLQDMAQKFQNGDFSGPAFIHGADMPGLAVLQHAGPEQLSIIYADEPAGASLSYLSRNQQIIAAVHDWFTAQLHDHGHHAMHHQHMQHRHDPVSP
ncbi:aspartate carbamoyltransferase [Methylomonas paludis]|uniref:Aspartate carbamoyltransferase n=1 Tax=Methylomonas paludis TaxID=1173101 RepID=A0A975ML80_9GAMM|nr:aspartate carbamoyltransferase [Methylomonas paludis]QWF69585.1 aspartate carbamoyltransferase [Methylomonas paludis]